MTTERPTPRSQSALPPPHRSDLPSEASATQDILDSLVVPLSWESLPELSIPANLNPSVVLDFSLETPRILEVRVSKPGTVEIKRAADPCQTLSRSEWTSIPFLRSLKESLDRSGITSRRVVVILPDHAAYHTTTELPPTHKRTMGKLIRQKAHRIEGLEGTLVSHGYFLDDSAGRSGQTKAIIAASSEDRILDLCHGLRSIGLDPTAIYPSIGVAHRLFNHVCVGHDEDSTGAIVEVDESSAKFTLLKRGRLYYDRKIRQDESGIEDTHLVLIRQIQRAILNHQQKHPEDPLRKMIVIHHGSQSPLASRLASEFMVPIYTIVPRDLFDASAENTSVSASSIGSFMLAGTRESQSWNLIPKEFRTRRRNFIFVLLTILSAAIGAFGGFQGRRQLNEANADRLEMLERCHSDIVRLQKYADQFVTANEARGRVLGLREALKDLNASDLKLGSILSEVSKSLESDAYLTSLVTERESINGESRALLLEGHFLGPYIDAQQAVSKLARNLMASGLIAEVSSAPLTALPFDSQEVVQFTLTCTLALP